MPELVQCSRLLRSLKRSDSSQLVNCFWNLQFDKELGIQVLYCRQCGKLAKYHGVFPVSNCGVTAQDVMQRRVASRCMHERGQIVGSGGAVSVKCACDSGGEVTHLAYGCEIHDRCLPSLIFRSEKQRAKWFAREPESSLYSSCDGCQDYIRESV